MKNMEIFSLKEPGCKGSYVGAGTKNGYGIFGKVRISPSYLRGKDVRECPWLCVYVCVSVLMPCLD